jgi:hypothetical protein
VASALSQLHHHAARTSAAPFHKSRGFADEGGGASKEQSGARNVDSPII